MSSLCYAIVMGCVSIVRRFDSPKPQ